MEKAEIIKKMLSRVDQCRRLVASTTDQRTAQVLRQIADEGGGHQPTAGEAGLTDLRFRFAARPPARALCPVVACR
jgi:hypothetical protein